MIITRQKELGDLLKSVGEGPVFIVGCSKCATVCQTGGEKEVLTFVNIFKGKGIKVTGWVILDPACHFNNNKRLLKPHALELKESKKILVLACGNGIQTVSEAVKNKEVIAGTDTLFLGEIVRTNEFFKRCTLCGECMLDLFNFCPLSLCPKSMLNGPCGGTRNGKCEVNNLDCVWALNLDHPEKFDEIQKPKDWSKSLESRRKI